MVDTSRRWSRNAGFGGQACSRLVLAMGIVLGALAARPASAIVFQTTAAENAGLGAGQSFLNAEAELILTHSDGSQSGCSGSLLAGGAYILTAAHCVTGDTDNLTTSGISIDFANTGLTLSSSTYVVDPVWNGNVQNGGDLAVIALSTPITSITGYTLDTTSSASGATVVLAGYGLTGTGTTGYTGSFGTLRFSTNVYLGVYASNPTVYGYTFRQTGPYASMIAPGDSGGGALINVNGTWEIVGVHDYDQCTTAGCTPDSMFGDYGADTSVYADAAFIESVVGVAEPPTALVLVVGAVMTVFGRRRRRTR